MGKLVESLNTKTNELMTKLFETQSELERVETEQSKLAEKESKLKEEVAALKAELLPLVSAGEDLKFGDLVAVRQSRTSFTWVDEKAIMEWLSKNGEEKYIKVKTTQAIDKKPLSKDLKTNTKLQEGLKDLVGDRVTEWVVVTDKYDEMMAHIESGE